MLSISIAYNVLPPVVRRLWGQPHQKILSRLLCTLVLTSCTAVSLAAAPVYKKSLPADDLPVEKLSPTSRELPLPSKEPQALDWRFIEAFAGHTLLITVQDAKKTGQILKGVQDELLIKPGDFFFSYGSDFKPGQKVVLAQPSPPLKRAGGSDGLGYATEILGMAEVVEVGEVATLKLLSNREEILPGAWVLADAPELYTSLIKTPVASDMKGEVVGIVSGQPVAAPNTIIAIAIDNNTPVERGNVVMLMKKSEQIRLPDIPGVDKKPPSDKTGKLITLPSTPVGAAVILTVKGSIALAYVTSTSGPVRSGTPVQAEVPSLPLQTSFP